MSVAEQRRFEQELKDKPTSELAREAREAIARSEAAQESVKPLIKFAFGRAVSVGSRY